MEDYKSKYKEFIFRDWTIEGSQITFSYAFDDDLEFNETLKLNNSKEVVLNQSLKEALNLYHLLAGISYYKAYPTKTLTVPYELDEFQAQYLNDTWEQGLGEYLLVNDLDPAILARFEGVGASLNSYDTNSADQYLVPIGGGKDSLVTCAALKKSDADFSTFRVNDIDWVKTQAKKISAKQHISISRSLDYKLFEANDRGALNGHVPITAIVSAAAIITAIVYGKSDVVMSNESSANIPNTTHYGLDVNHQYSKSLKAERGLNSYLKNYIASNMSYVSLLRPLSELHICELFVQYLWDEYSGLWSSSNSNFRVGEAGQVVKWDTDSAKTHSVFGMMAAFMDREKLITEFGHNLFKNVEESDLWRELLGLKDIKPLDCVADIDEMRLALTIAKESGQWPELDVYQVPEASLTDHKILDESDLNDKFRKILINYIT